MHKREYFLWAMKNNLYMVRRWIVSSFTVQKDRPYLADSSYVGEIILGDAPNQLYFHALIDGVKTAVKIDDCEKDRPVFNAKEKIIIQPNDTPLNDTVIETIYGSVLANMVILHYPFKQKFKFSTKVFGGWFEDILAERLTDNVYTTYKHNGMSFRKLDELTNDPNKVYVYEYERYAEACGFLASMAPIFASSGSLGTMTVDPKVLQLRNKLIKEHAHEINNKTVQAKIDDALVKADQESFKDDPDGRDFLISKKSWNPTRKKALILIGGSSGFGQGGDQTFITGSLRDKWKIPDIPAHANEARAGSYFRGKETQYGGAEVKTAYRMTLTSSVKMDYCGTKRGKVEIITEDNKQYFIGLFIVGTKAPIEITKENVAQYLNKPYQIHSPMYCKVEGSSYCATCVGKNYSRLRTGIPSAVANVGDVYMYDKMKRMHGKAMVLAKLNINLVMY